MAVKNQYKLKKTPFVNKLLPGQPTQFKLAMVTPIVVTKEKFVENVVNHTGLNRTIVRSVIDAIEECAGDYMELGNAVQLGADFGTLKPSIKVKAVDSPEKCTAETVTGIGLKFIPTGNMRTRLGTVGFVVKGVSDGSDVEDSEVEPNDPNGGGTSGNGGGTNGTQNGGTQGTEPVKYRIVFEFSDNTQDDHEYEEGDTINYPTPTTGYQWPTSKPATMPARNVTVTEELIPSAGTKTITYKHEGAVYQTQEYAVGATVTAPTPPTGYIWMGVPGTMPNRDVEIISAASGGDPLDL